MWSLLPALEWVQAVSRDKDFYTLHPELVALFLKVGLFSSKLWGVVFVCNCCFLKIHDHGTKDLQVIFHCKYWFSLVRTSPSTQILAMLQ